MELKEYFGILKKNLAFIIFLAALGAMIAYLLTSNFSGGERVQKHYLLVRGQTEISELGRPLIYQESSDLTDTAVAILETYDIRKEILEKQENLIVRKEAPGVLSFQASADNADRAYEIIQLTALHFNENVADRIIRDNKISLEDIGTSYQALAPALDKKITTIFGLILGTAFAIFAIGLKTYFKV